MYRKVFANKVFDRKVVLITGGCAGIGRALAIRLAQAGARLVILDLQQAALERRHRGTIRTGREAGRQD